MTPPEDNLLSFFGRGAGDPDIQAGSRGLSIQNAVARYLKTPGHLLSLLRFFSKEEVEQVAEATGIAVQSLRDYEQGKKEPTLSHLATLAAHYKGDLRVLLEAFGHVSQDASPTSMGLAAQFNDELDDSEKLDLKKLVAAFATSKE